MISYRQWSKVLIEANVSDDLMRDLDALFARYETEFRNLEKTGSPTFRGVVGDIGKLTKGALKHFSHTETEGDVVSEATATDILGRLKEDVKKMVGDAVKRLESHPELHSKLDQVIGMLNRKPAQPLKGKHEEDQADQVLDGIAELFTLSGDKLKMATSSGEDIPIKPRDPRWRASVLMAATKDKHFMLSLPGVDPLEFSLGNIQRFQNVRDALITTSGIDPRAPEIKGRRQKQQVRASDMEKWAKERPGTVQKEPRGEENA